MTNDLEFYNIMFGSSEQCFSDNFYQTKNKSVQGRTKFHIKLEKGKKPKGNKK